MTDTHTWVKHRETGGLWLCPTEALDDQRGLGWETTDERPTDPNPAVAEMLAWRQAQEQHQSAQSGRSDEEMSDG